MAKEAGVSLAMVTKYFPTREELFAGCTAHFLHLNPIPSPERWAEIEDPWERLERVVTGLHGVNERAFGHSWTAYRLAGDSAVLAGMVQAIEGLCQVSGRIVVGETVPAERRAERAAFVAGLLSPQTYRSLRLVSRLEPDAAARYTARAIAGILGITPPAGGP